MPTVEPAARQHVDRRQLLRGEHRRPVRHDQHRQHQPQPRRRRGKPGGKRQHLVAMRAVGRIERAAFGIGIAGLGHVGQGHMVGDGQVVVAERLALAGDARHDLGLRQGAAIGQVEAELHNILRLAPAVCLGGQCCASHKYRPRQIRVAAHASVFSCKMRLNILASRGADPAFRQGSNHFYGVGPAIRADGIVPRFVRQEIKGGNTDEPYPPHRAVACIDCRGDRGRRAVRAALAGPGRRVRLQIRHGACPRDIRW